MALPTPEPPAQLFPAAAQPNLIRSQQKDELYLQYLTDACHDAVRRLLGPHRALRWASETRTLAELLYFALTTGSGLQTLGEEYCDILQVAGGGTAGAAAPPGPTRRGVLVLLQALGPYLAERLAAPEDDGFAAWQQAQAAARAESARQQRWQQQQQQQETQPATAAALLLQRVAAAAQQLAAATQHAARPVTRHLPAAASFLTQHGGTLVRIHLALFYIFGLYYQPSKRMSGVRYLFLGRAFEGRPSYRFLGFLLLTQLSVSGLAWLLRRHGGLPWLLAGGAAEQQARRPTHAMLLAEDGKPLSDAPPATAATATAAAAAARAAGEGLATAAGGPPGEAGREPPSSRKCPLCLSVRSCPTATPCGHVFCWQCITDWGNQKTECPLCRADFALSSLVCVRHADF